MLVCLYREKPWYQDSIPLCQSDACHSDARMSRHSSKVAPMIDKVY